MNNIFHIHVLCLEPEEFPQQPSVYQRRCADACDLHVGPHSMCTIFIASCCCGPELWPVDVNRFKERFICEYSSRILRSGMRDSMSNGCVGEHNSFQNFIRFKCCCRPYSRLETLFRWGFPVLGVSPLLPWGLVSDIILHSFRPWCHALGKTIGCCCIMLFTSIWSEALHCVFDCPCQRSDLRWKTAIHSKTSLLDLMKRKENKKGKISATARKGP